MALISLYQIQDGEALAQLAKSGATLKTAQVDNIKVTAESSAPVTSFKLTKTPDSQLVKMSINNILYTENKEFTVDRSQNMVTWNFTKSRSGFDIDKDLTDQVDFIYYASK